MPHPIAIHWFRRDLRLNDNAALFRALQGPLPVLPVFIFDTDILDRWEDKSDARVSFIHQSLQRLQSQLAAQGATLHVLHGEPLKCWETLSEKYTIQAVYANRDYEPYAEKRDAAVAAFLAKKGIRFETHKDQVIFEKDEVLKSDGTPYTVFTPYARRWREKMAVTEPFEHFPSEGLQARFLRATPLPIPSLRDLGFVPTTIPFPEESVSEALIAAYAEKRNFPAIRGTSRLGVHFRFGTISVREKARKAAQLSEIFLNELIWRDFYAQILAHFPYVAERAFRPAYDRIAWRNAPEDFARWCAGSTGYPIVDAGMRELNTTGFMHNRVRMIVASFLSKHLLIDWRLGEAYFAQKLLDFDLASNNGGWQWAAGCGTDAAPYFRIFSPSAQQEKFDKNGEYVRRWVPELGTPKYPTPMVEHAFARERCIAVYKEGLGRND